MRNRRGDERERSVPRKDTHSLEVILRVREETESLLRTTLGDEKAWKFRGEKARIIMGVSTGNQGTAADFQWSFMQNEH